MPKLFQAINTVVRGAGSVVKESLRTILRDPHIMIYPYLAVGFILITSPLVSSIVISLWHKVEAPTVINSVNQTAPHTWLAHFGLVSFSVFYAVFVTDFFVCAVSAATIASLEEHKNIGWFDGLNFVRKHFWRVAKFALLALLFFPIGLVAQRQRLKSPRGAVETIISSLTLGMVQLAPAIVKGHDGVAKTIRHSVDTLGHFWKENLVIRIGAFVAIVGLGLISFLPKLVQHYWFDNSTARIFGWVLTALLGVSSYVMLHVMSTVFTTNLYLRAERERRRR